MNISEFLRSLAPKGKPDNADALAGAIARLMAEKSAAETEMVTIAERRTALLMADDDAALDRDEHASEQAYRVVERCNLALADLRTRLDAARAAERAARWEETKKRFDASLGEFAATYRRALDAYENLAQVRHEAQGAGFAEESRALIAVPHILSRDLLHQFESESARHRAAAVRQIKLVPREVDHPVGYFNPAEHAFAPKAAPVVVTAPKDTPAHARIAKAKPAPVAQPKPFKAPLPDEKGDVSIVLLRSGYETPGGHRPRMGETVSVPMAAGLRVVESGAAEFARAV